MKKNIENNSIVKEIRIVEDEIHKVKRKNMKNISNIQINKSKGILEISKSKMSEICKYHKNMARNHPQTNRSSREQEKRDKNTTACRVSRRAKKLQEIIIEEEYKDSLQMHDEVVEETLRSLVYMQSLLELITNII